MTKSTVKWKLLLSTPDESEAYSLKSRLESEGINCRLESIRDFPSPGGKDLINMLKVYVPLADFEASVQAVDSDLDEDP